MALAINLIYEEDTRANQPAAAAAIFGALYCVTDEGNIVERNNGTSWEPYSPVAVSGLLAAKGNLISASAAATPSILSVGTNGQFLVAASGETSGLDWVTVGDQTANVGYLNVPQNSQSAAYPIVLADAGKHILHPTADNNPRTFTIPANGSIAFPIGSTLTFVNLINVVTIAITTDTLIWAFDGSTGSIDLAQWGVATAIKVTTTSWIISGTGLS